MAGTEQTRGSRVGVLVCTLPVLVHCREEVRSMQVKACWPNGFPCTELIEELDVLIERLQEVDIPTDAELIALLDRCDIAVAAQSITPPYNRLVTDIEKMLERLQINSETPPPVEGDQVSAT